MTRAYDEFVEFIARGFTVADVIAFRPSDDARARVVNLATKGKVGRLTPVERAELDHFLHGEHVMRLAKARACTGKDLA